MSATKPVMRPNAASTEPGHADHPAAARKAAVGSSANPQKWLSVSRTASACSPPASARTVRGAQPRYRRGRPSAAAPATTANPAIPTNSSLPLGPPGPWMSPPISKARMRHRKEQDGGRDQHEDQVKPHPPAAGAGDREREHPGQYHGRRDDDGFGERHLGPADRRPPPLADDGGDAAQLLPSTPGEGALVGENPPLERTVVDDLLDPPEAAAADGQHQHDQAQRRQAVRAPGPPRAAARRRVPAGCRLAFPAASQPQARPAGSRVGCLGRWRGGCGLLRAEILLR